MAQQRSVQPAACSKHICCPALCRRPLQQRSVRAERAVRCNAEQSLEVQARNATSASAAHPSSSGPTPSGGSTNPGRTAVFKASKWQSIELQEKEKPLASYMTLPASQYSVLDAKKIVRLDDNTFSCYVGGLAFGSWTVEPVLTLSVTVEEQGCTIRLLSCKLSGPPIVQQINDKFSASMTNMVRYKDTSDATVKTINSDTTVEVCVEIPGWCSFVPASAISSTGSRVMQATLDAMVPRFLQQLEKDYQMWAAGDSSRRPVGEL